MNHGTTIVLYLLFLYVRILYIEPWYNHNTIYMIYNIYIYVCIQKESYPHDENNIITENNRLSTLASPNRSDGPSSVLFICLQRGSFGASEVTLKVPLNYILLSDWMRYSVQQKTSSPMSSI